MGDTKAIPVANSQGPQPISKIDVLWITAGLGCDGDTIAKTSHPAEHRRHCAGSHAWIRLEPDCECNSEYANTARTRPKPLRRTDNSGARRNRMPSKRSSLNSRCGGEEVSLAGLIGMRHAQSS